MRSAAKAAIKSAIAEGGSFADITPIEGINFASTSRAAGEEGIFEISGYGSIEVTGGVDVSPGKSFKGSLSAPEGAKTVTPVTTLVDKAFTAAAARGETIDVETVTK